MSHAPVLYQTWHVVVKISGGVCALIRLQWLLQVRHQEEAGRKPIQQAPQNFRSRGLSADTWAKNLQSYRSVELRCGLPDLNFLAVMRSAWTGWHDRRIASSALSRSQPHASPICSLKVITCSSDVLLFAFEVIC